MLSTKTSLTIFRTARVKKVHPKYQRGSKNGILEQVDSSKSKKMKHQSDKDGGGATKLA